LIDDAFMTPVLENGNEYYIRRSNYLRDGGRKRDIVDEVMNALRL
jgi:hypothetical protein